ncbi:MoaD/ThiS family protein [Mycoplasmatota bacterium]|nr:MoaD/ThiS family protein [Mycoplasmatota bacterium]
MKINVKLFATFRIGRGKIVYLDYYEGMTVKNIIDELGIKKEEIAIIIVGPHDGTPEKMLTFKVEPNMTVHLFPPVAGG